MNLSIVGLSYFGEKLCRDLQRFHPGNRYRFYDTYRSRLAQVRFMLDLPMSDMVLSLNGVSDFSGSIESAYRLGKKICFQWQGTDVSLAVSRKQNGQILERYIRKAHHLSVAPWLSDELNTIGIKAKTLDFKWCYPTQNLHAFPGLQVYTYLVEGREQFYGWNLVKMLAENHPETVFYVAGSRGTLLDKPSNVVFLGWLPQEKMQELRDKCAVYLRLPEHDGYSYSVLEALASGSEVLWVRPGAHCHFVNPQNVSEVFKQVCESIQTRGFARNLQYLEYIRTEHEPVQVLGTLLKELHAILEN